jgi:hypothetical protein
MTALVASALAALSGCGGSSRDDALADAGTAPAKADAEDDGTALLERVALGRHEGFDRVVFRFRNHVPGYDVRYVEPPLHQDGSGDVVPIDGDAVVLVRMEPASGFDLEAAEGELVYTGPRRIDGASAGTSQVRELARTGDFEATLGWGIGLASRTGFRVLTLDEPPRLVVDFQSE